MSFLSSIAGSYIGSSLAQESIDYNKLNNNLKEIRNKQFFFELKTLDFEKINEKLNLDHLGYVTWSEINDITYILIDIDNGEIEERLDSLIFLKHIIEFKNENNNNKSKRMRGL